MHLLCAGAPIASRNVREMTSLHYAAMSGSTECCQLLVDRSADLNAEVRAQCGSFGMIMMMMLLVGVVNCISSFVEIQSSPPSHIHLFFAG